MSEDLVERLKYVEFNKTDYKVLRKLVDKAIERGDEVQKQQNRFRDKTKQAYDILSQAGFICRLGKTDLDTQMKTRCTIAIDGSYQLTGGTAGLWFGPITCVRIFLREGVKSIEKFDAEKDLDTEGDIIIIDERKCQSVYSEIERRMLEFETKAIMLTSGNAGSILMIDGSIVDPPEYKEPSYVKYRCDAIKNCLANDMVVVGCVKRIRDNFLKRRIEDNIAKTEVEKNVIQEFPTDLHLMSYIFTYMRVQLGIDDVLFTKPIETSEDTPVYRAYKAEAVRIFSFFIQKDLKSLILRLDVPCVSNEGQVNINEIEIAKLVALWTYPELGTPLPLYLAHEKCKVRKGCADVLYDEILARMRATDPFNQIASFNLR
jgi:hypothetical protein